MNKLLITILLILAITFSACGSNIPTEQETIKIGAVYPLTGMFASYGLEYQRGLEMAAEEINAQGGINGRQIKLIFEDDEGSVEKSVTATNKLIQMDGVKYLFTGFSSNSQATAPIAQENKVVYMSATVSKIGEIGDYIFRDYWDMEDQGKATGNAINQEGFQKVGVIALNFGDTEFFMKGLKDSLNDAEIIEERFNFGDSDFKTQLTKIKTENVDAILVYGFPGAETMKITQQINEIGLDDKRLIGASQYGFHFMYSQFAETLEKMEAIDSWYSLDQDNVNAVEFIQKYEQKYGEELVGDAAYPYDDLYALKIAIEKANTAEDTLKVANELKKVDMDGVAGRLSFDEEGNSLRTAYLQIFTKDGWEKYNIN